MREQFCTACGEALHAENRFCTRCGRARTDTQAPEAVRFGGRPRGPHRWVVSGLVAATALVASAHVGASLVSGGSPSTPPPPTISAGESPYPAATSSAAPGPTARVSVGEALNQIVARDAATVSSLTGAWVPQVSSKRVGLEVNGVIYDQEAILVDHLQLRGHYPDAVLLKSDRFATFSSTGFFVTVVSATFTTPDAANAWCDRAGLPADACFAKRLATPAGGGPSTVPR